MGRKKAEDMTEEEKAKAKYRADSPRHVVTFETDMDEDMKRHAFAYAERLRILGNDAVYELRKRIGQMMRTKRYRSLQKDYAWHSEHMKGLAEESEAYKKLEKERDSTAKEMSAMQKDYGVTQEDVRQLTQMRASKYGVGTIFGQSRGEAIWQACKTVVLGNGRNLHFKKKGDLPIIKAKEAERGIVIKLDKKGDLLFSMEGIGKFGVKMPEKDLFLQDEYASLIAYLSEPGQEDERVKFMMETGQFIPCFRPCYASLKCETIRGKLRVYVQVTVADKACPKKDKHGNPRHDFSKTGRVGCDNGTQSYAAVADQQVILDNLAERDHKSTKASEKRIRRRQRKMDASRRKSNPERFNKDGTYKKGSRGKWKKSKKYRRMAYLNREQMRKDALTRKYAIQTDANRLRSLGDRLIIEPSNARALQKKAKQTKEKSSKTIEVKQKDGTTKTVHKNKRRKRFGWSIHHRCPGAFQAELGKKFGDGYHEVSGRTFKASQYDHVLGDCIKKKLSQRWHELPDGKKVQRDVYAAFLMYCSNDSFTSPDQELCVRKFDEFFERHQRLVQDIIDNGLKVCNSGINNA